MSFAPDYLTCSFTPDFRSETWLVCFLFTTNPDVSARTDPRISDWCGVVFGLRSLLGKLAPFAESLNFQRTAQQRELSQAVCTFEKLVHFGYLYVVYPSSSDAKDVVIKHHVAVKARNVVQERYLARLSDFAKLLQNSMDRGQ
jgi:hypothetical protein